MPPTFTVYYFEVLYSIDSINTCIAIYFEAKYVYFEVYGCSHTHLEELAQRLDELEVHGGGQAADVVVRLDDGGRPLVGDGLDDVGVQRALQQEVHLAYLQRLLLW
jgi:hypothetical protein